MANILLVDDSADDREFVAQALEDEHTIFSIDNWIEASEYIFKYDLDLVLLDVNMPGLKGDQVAEILMKSVKNKPLNIVLFSAIDENELGKKAREIGTNGYIAKTPDVNVLRLKVKKALKK